jgi:hypothetical protein
MQLLDINSRVHKLEATTTESNLHDGSLSVSVVDNNRLTSKGWDGGLERRCASNKGDESNGKLHGGGCSW